MCRSQSRLAARSVGVDVLVAVGDGGTVVGVDVSVGVVMAVRW